MDITIGKMLDVDAPQLVQFEISKDGRTVYAHADGVTLMRACRVGEVVITDHRDNEATPAARAARLIAERDAVDGIQREHNQAQRNQLR